MSIFKLRKLNSWGHLHFVAPVLAMVAVAGIGGLYLALIHAQTQNCIQLVSQNKAFQQAATSSIAPLNKDGKSQDGTGYHCVQYIQQMLNAVYNLNAASPGVGSDPSYVTSLKSTLVLKTDPYVVSGTYDAVTTAQVNKFHAWAQGKLKAKKAGASSWGSLNMPQNGNVDSNTWAALCFYTLTMYNGNYSLTNTPAGVVHHSDPRWISRSYMRSGISAARNAGCGQFNAKTTLVTSVWGLNGVTTESHSGNTVTFTSSVKNAGPALSGAFRYGARYFYSNVDASHLSRSSSGAYAGGKELLAAGNKSTVFLRSGGSVAIGQTIAGSTVKGKYLCGTVAFDPTNYLNARNGRSTAVCVAMTTPSTPSGGGNGSGGGLGSGLPPAPTVATPCTSYTESRGQYNTGCVLMIQAFLNTLYDNDTSGFRANGVVKRWQHRDTFGQEALGDLKTTNVYDAATYQRVVSYQTWLGSLSSGGFGVDGVIGRGTWYELCYQSQSKVFGNSYSQSFVTSGLSGCGKVL